MGYDRQQFGGNISAADLAVMYSNKLKAAAENISELVFVEDVESGDAVIGGVFTLLNTYTLTVQAATNAIKTTVTKGGAAIGEYSASQATGTQNKGMGYILAADPYAAALLVMNKDGDNKAAFILTTDGASWYGASSSSGEVAIPGSVLWTDEATMTQIYSSAVRLPYTVAGTDVEIIEGLALVTGTQKAITAQGLYDSSNVTAKTRFNLDGEAFFAVNGNILIKL